MIKPENKTQRKPVFYHKDEALEIKIEFKKDYSSMTPEDRIFYMVEDIMVLMEYEEEQLKQIAALYD
jgi:hypothetical protein